MNAVVGVGFGSDDKQSNDEVGSSPWNLLMFGKCLEPAKVSVDFVMATQYPPGLLGKIVEMVS